MKLIPELCVRCKFQENENCNKIECLRPTILSFKLENNKSFSNCSDALELLNNLLDDIDHLIESCCDDVRNVPKVL